MKKKIILLCVYVFFISNIICQVAINNCGTYSHSIADLDLDWTSKGLLIPRMTTSQRNSINSPAHSLLIFNTTTNCFEWWDNSSSQWISMSCGCNLPTTPTATSATNIQATSFSANWNASTGATGYYLDVATNASFTTFVSGYNNLNVGNITTYTVSGLTCNTTYYYRVRAYNTCGTTANSNTITVTTSACNPTCTAGGITQTWLGSNSDVGNMINGSNEQNNNTQVEKYCYNNLPANCTSYGGLYQWAEAMQFDYTYNNANASPDYTCDPCYGSGRQGICPAGYHIPTDLEWSRYEWCVETTIAPVGSTSLSTFQNTIGWRGDNSTAGPGYKMKHNSLWNGSNVSGFGALAGGYRIYDGSGFSFGTSNGFYWTTVERSSSPNDQALMRQFAGTENRIERHESNYKRHGMTVRCLQN
ncbi:MAG: fibronectin type III domain-containing protein [Bacteroidales bacterium]|nr:fibronectin type III domain-containing protein [Bacteroidales bacterium]